MKKKSKSTLYDAQRKSKDPYYKRCKSLRSLLSVIVKRYCNGEYDISSKTLDKYLGASTNLVLMKLAVEASTNGYDLFTQYGTKGNLEVDHIKGVTAFEPLVESIGLEEALKQAFNWKNLTITTRTKNRNHRLKPESLKSIRKGQLKRWSKKTA